jgi:hypothetical protein
MVLSLVDILLAAQLTVLIRSIVVFLHIPQLAVSLIYYPCRRISRRAARWITRFGARLVANQAGYCMTRKQVIIYDVI